MGEAKVNKTLVCLRGIQGAGKTTLGALITPLNVSADDYRTGERDLYSHTVSKNVEVHLKCQTQIEKWMEEDLTPIAVHNTFSQLWELTPYLKLAQKYGYKVHIVTVEDHHASGDIHDAGHYTKKRTAERWEIVDPYLRRAHNNARQEKS